MLQFFCQNEKNKQVRFDGICLIENVFKCIHNSIISIMEFANHIFYFLKIKKKYLNENYA